MSSRAHSLFSAALAGASLWLVIELWRGGVPWTPAFFAAVFGLWRLRSASGEDFWARRGGLAVFLACLAAYLSTFRWHGGDDAPNSLIPFCLLRHKTLTLDPVLDPWFTNTPGKLQDFTVLFGRRRLSIFPVAAGVLALPVYLIPALAGVLPAETFLHHLSKLSASLMTAASVWVLHRVVSRRCGRGWALCLAALYGLGSWSFSVSSQALWQHGPAQLGAALGLWGLDRDGFRWDCLAGLGFALAAAARPDSAFFFMATAAFLLLRRRDRLPGFLAGAAAPLALVASYWLYYTGRLAPPESAFQSHLFTRFQPEAFAGLILSPTRGLLFYFPAALFGIWSGLRLSREPFARWLLAACAGPWVLLSFYSTWVGGNTFGPRYFSVAALVLAYLCADAEREVRSRPGLLAAWCGAVAWSVLVHAAGAYFNWPGSARYDVEKAQLWWWSLHPVPNLFAAAGPLHALPALARWLLGGSILAAFARLSARLRRALAGRPGGG